MCIHAKKKSMLLSDRQGSLGRVAPGALYIDMMSFQIYKDGYRFMTASYPGITAEGVSPRVRYI